MKIILILFLLLAAYGLVVALLRRLTDTSKQLADLHEQLARNNAQLSEQMAAMREREQEKDKTRL